MLTEKIANLSLGMIVITHSLHLSMPNPDAVVTRKGTVYHHIRFQLFSSTTLVEYLASSPSKYTRRKFLVLFVDLQFHELNLASITAHDCQC
jgi:hypothetical protein